MTSVKRIQTLSSTPSQSKPAPSSNGNRMNRLLDRLKELPKTERHYQIERMVNSLSAEQRTDAKTQLLERVAGFEARGITRSEQDPTLQVMKELLQAINLKEVEQLNQEILMKLSQKGSATPTQTLFGNEE